MNERGTLPEKGSRSTGAARWRVLVLALILFAGAGAVYLVWLTSSQGRPGAAPRSADENAPRKVKYWWDPMTNPPFISDHPGKSPMGMDLVPVYEDDARAAAEPAAAKEAGAAPAATTWYCPMHPHYTSNRPGECPICSMQLVPMKSGDSSTASTVEGHANITLDAGRRQLIGVRTGLVEKKPVQRIIRAVGRVEYDEKRLSSVNLKVGGWVEELFVKSTGEEVHRGDPLFSLYSPELIEAERNFLLASRAAPPAGEGDELARTTLRSARERLLLLDLGEDQIRALESKQDVPRLTTIVAKSDGVVTKRNVVQGTSIEPGRDLYELADLSNVWLQADVYEYELPLVHVGLEARVQLASQSNEPYTGKVIFVYPYLNEATRTVRLRIELPNPERKLKPGMYATAFLAVELGEQLVVDDQAVLYTGTREIVFVDLGSGHLEPREVRVGEHADGQVVIESGLAQGERVVTSGNFLVDSESRLKAALLKGSQDAPSEHAGHGK
jgi:multidrug efflux pump subunit AcrA (membrane-fusion protein)